MQCKQCRIEKKDEQLVLSILSKLGLEFLVFVSPFHSGRLRNLNWRISSLDSFRESIIQEQDKLIKMGATRSSKNKSLLDRETKNAKGKRKQKGNDKRNAEFKPKEEFDPSDEALVSKKEKDKRF